MADCGRSEDVGKRDAIGIREGLGKVHEHFQLRQGKRIVSLRDEADGFGEDIVHPCKVVVRQKGLQPFFARLPGSLDGAGVLVVGPRFVRLLVERFQFARKVRKCLSDIQMLEYRRSCQQDAHCKNGAK